MKNKFSVAIFTILALIFLLSQSSLGIDVVQCKDCHGNVKPIPTASLTKDCMVCHFDQGGHLGTPPETRVPAEVHSIHGNDRKVSDKPECKVCHHDYPIECVNCHNSHDNLNSIKIQTPGINPSICTDCHGQLPQPEGHSNFRAALGNSKHQWMNCQTCHLNQVVGNDNGKINYVFNLHFKDLFTTSINDSIDLCKICHSLQYTELKAGTHGVVNKTCVDCHNPHTTSSTGVQTAPKPSLNVSTTIGSAEDWVTTRVPILKNTVLMTIIIIIIVMTVSEYILSKEEEGKKTAYHTVKVHSSEDTLKTLEVTLENQNINIISDILERNDINIMGMTMTKHEDTNIYKYVIFVDIKEPIDENSLISKLTTMNDVRSAIFTDRYEL